MHSTQEPLSAVNTAATQENFPALQHYFPCDESSIDTTARTITDTIGGVVMTNPTALTLTNGNLTGLSIPTDTALTSGSWTSAPAGKHIVMMIIGTTGSGLGLFAIAGLSGANPRYGWSDGVGKFSVHDGTDLTRWYWRPYYRARSY